MNRTHKFTLFNLYYRKLNYKNMNVYILLLIIKHISMLKL